MEDSSYLTLTHQTWESEQAVLHQVQDDQERVIAYANRALNKAEHKIISLWIIYRESVLNWALFKLLPIWNIYKFKTGDKILLESSMKKDAMYSIAIFHRIEYVINISNIRKDIAYSTLATHTCV